MHRPAHEDLERVERLRDGRCHRAEALCFDVEPLRVEVRSVRVTKEMAQGEERLEIAAQLAWQDGGTHPGYLDGALREQFPMPPVARRDLGVQLISTNVRFIRPARMHQRKGLYAVHLGRSGAGRFSCSRTHSRIS